MESQNQESVNLSIPHHVGFILDGNRRWMKNKNLLGIAHKIGADKVEDLIDWSYELGIKTITLYVLSTENLVRECDYLVGYSGGFCFSSMRLPSRINPT